VIAAWTRAALVTGDAEFDSVIAELRPGRVSRQWADIGNGVFLFGVEVGVLYNEDVLQTKLAPTSSWETEPVHYPRDDGSWYWRGETGGTGKDSDTAEIEFTFGWGDCFVACFGSCGPLEVSPREVGVGIHSRISLRSG